MTTRLWRWRLFLISTIILSYLLSAVSANAQNSNVARVSVFAGNGQVACQCSTSTLQSIQPISVQATDVNGIPVPGATVVWFVTSGQATVGASATVTNSQGIATNTVSLLISDTQATGATPYLVSTIQAIAKNNSVTFTEIQSLLQGDDSIIQATAPTFGGASLSQATLSANVGSMLSTPIQVHVAAVGISGVPNVSVRLINAQTSPALNCTYFGGYADPGSVLTNATGDAICYPVFSGSGTGTFNVLVGGEPESGGVAQGLQSFGPFTFTSVPGPPAAMQIIAGNNQVGVAGQALNPLVARLADANGNAVQNQAMTWTVTPAGAVTLTNAQSFTDNNGEVSTSAALNPSAASGVQVTVALQSNPKISATFQLSLIGVVTSLTKISGDGQSAQVGTYFALPLVVQVNNASGPVTNYPVQFFTTGPVSITSGTTVSTNASGQAAVTVQAGSIVGTATVTAVAGLSSLTFTLTVTNASTIQPNGLTMISGNNQTVNINTAFPVPLIVQVNSVAGPVSGFPVSFSVTGPVTISSSSVVTNTNGLAQVTVQAGATAGTATVGAVINAGSTAFAFFFTLTVLPPGISVCNFAIAPVSQVIPAAGGTGSIGVLTSAGCVWNASSPTSFPPVTSGFSGTGPGTVQFSAAANASAAARTGFLIIGGQFATIDQPGTAPLLLVTPTNNTIQWQQQSPLPPAIPLSIFTTASSLSYTATASSTGNWLTVSPASGSAPGTVMVSANPASLSPGYYVGTITVTAPAANPATQVSAISLTVTAAGAPALSVTTKSLTYAFLQGAKVQTQRIPVGNSGGGTLTYQATASTAAGGNWLSETRDGAGATFSAPDALAVTVDPSTLGPGTYTGLITITADTTRTIPVMMSVSAGSQTIALSQTGLTFTAVASGGAVPSQSFGILNGGTGSMGWSVTNSTVTGGNWMSVTPGSGASDAGSSSVPLVTVSVNPANLSPGQYSGQIQVTATGANNTPECVSVVLNVLPSGSNPGPLALPASLIFTSASGGSAAASQTLTLSNLTASPQTFATAKLTADGANWLSVTPATGSVAPAQSTTLTVSVSGAGLSPAIRQGFLTLSFQDGSVRIVDISYVLAGAATAPCTPTKLLPVVTSLGSPFTVPAAWPNSLAAQVVDDCGNPHVSGTVTASFSNGDPPVLLTPLKNGAWTGTWQVRNAGVSAVTITMSADNPSLAISGAVSVSGTLQISASAPIVSAGGILNAASYAPSAPLSPGAMISIFGSNLANGTGRALTFPLPSELSGTLVTIGGVAAPLLYAGSGQINAIIPYGLPVNTNAQVIVQQGTAYTSPEPIAVAAASPAIFTQSASGSGQGVIIVYSSGMYAQPGSPAQAGDEIVIYAGGLGATTPAATNSQAATASPLLEVPGVSLTIGGQPARVDFAGLTPGYSGLYQINAAVPAGVHGDTLPVVLTVAGQSSPAVTMAVQ